MGLLDVLFGRREEEPVAGGRIASIADMPNFLTDPNLPKSQGIPPPAPERYNHSDRRLINGGLRDVLGALADAHAESQGMDPLYRAKRQKEQTAEALDGFDTDPLGAIRRYAKIDPAGAQKYYAEWQEAQRNQRRDGETARENAFTRNLKGRELVGGLIRSARTPEARVAAIAQARKLGEQYGIDLSDLPDGTNPQALADWTYGTASVKDQLASEYKGERLKDFDLDRPIKQQTADNGSKNAESGAIRANTDRQYKRAGVIDRGIRTGIQARNSAVNATGRNADRAARWARPAQSKASNDQVIDGFKLRPGKRDGGTATLPNGRKVTWSEAESKWKK